MDTFASLALATEAPSISLLDRKPHNRNEFMISKVYCIYLTKFVIFFDRLCSNILWDKRYINSQ